MRSEYSPRRCEYTLPLGNLGAESYFMMPRACLVPLSRVCGRIIKITISTPTAERSQESGPLPAHFVRPPDLLSSDSCRKWAGSASNQLTSGSLLGRPYFGSLPAHFGPLLCHTPCAHKNAFKGHFAFSKLGGAAALCFVRWRAARAQCSCIQSRALVVTRRQPEAGGPPSRVGRRG